MQRKTRLDVFLEQHPEENLNAQEVLNSCIVFPFLY